MNRPPDKSGGFMFKGNDRVSGKEGTDSTAARLGAWAREQGPVQSSYSGFICGIDQTHLVHEAVSEWN